MRRYPSYIPTSRPRASACIGGAGRYGRSGRAPRRRNRARRPPAAYLRSGVTWQALIAPPHYGSCLAFIVRRLEHFLPSSTRAESLVYTLDTRIYQVYMYEVYILNDDAGRLSAISDYSRRFYGCLYGRLLVFMGVCLLACLFVHLFACFAPCFRRFSLIVARLARLVGHVFVFVLLGKKCLRSRYTHQHPSAQTPFCIISLLYRRYQCVACNLRQVNALMAVCDNPLHGIASELSTKACETVRSCVGGALTAIKEVVEVASDVGACWWCWCWVFMLVVLVLVAVMLVVVLVLMAMLVAW